MARRTKITHKTPLGQNTFLRPKKKIVKFKTSFGWVSFDSKQTPTVKTSWDDYEESLTDLEDLIPRYKKAHEKLKCHAKWKDCFITDCEAILKRGKKP